MLKTQQLQPNFDETCHETVSNKAKGKNKKTKGKKSNERHKFEKQTTKQSPQKAKSIEIKNIKE